MLHFVTSYMSQNKSRKQTLESAQYGLEISFKRSRFASVYTTSNVHRQLLTYSMVEYHESVIFFRGI